jgi:hypothetical protein
MFALCNHQQSYRWFVSSNSREVQMPVRSSKREAGATGGPTQQLARPVILVRAAVPIAKTAGMAARDGARSAIVWVVPRVDGARAWTAPRIEQGGLAIRDTVAPRISEMLTATARRVDVTAPRVDVAAPRRTWPKMAAVTIMIAAGAAAAAVALRRRKHDGTRGVREEQAAGAGTGPQIAQDGQPHADADGRASTEEDASRQSPAT